MSNELSIPETKPKTRKDDVIRALVIIAQEKHEKALEETKQARIDAEERLKKAAVKYAKAHAESMESRVNVYSRALEVELRIPLDTLPPFVASALSALESIPKLKPFDAAATREAIRGQMEADKVQSLLCNPEFRTAADSFLSAII